MTMAVAAIATISTFLLLIYTSTAYAQILVAEHQIAKTTVKPQSSYGNLTTNPQAKSMTLLNSNNSKIPVISKISDKGNYRVLLMWGLPPNEFSKKSFDMELLFLNASAPLPTKQTVPQRESSTKGDSNLGADAFLIQPGIIKSTVPIDSYNITIYSTNGKVLWKKVNQPVTAGRGFERVTFANGYSGGITIQLTNIKSGNIPINSVTFTSKVAVKKSI
jgi:hypothetical protein